MPKTPITPKITASPPTSAAPRHRLPKTKQIIIKNPRNANKKSLINKTSDIKEQRTNKHNKSKIE